MVSNYDHCLEDLLYCHRTGELAMHITAVASNVPCSRWPLNTSRLSCRVDFTEARDGLELKIARTSDPAGDQTAAVRGPVSTRLMLRQVHAISSRWFSSI